MIEIKDLRCEYKKNPPGIDIESPRLSWKIVSNRHDVMQQAYQIQVALTKEDLLSEKALIWDSGSQETDQSIHVVYRGAMLESRQRCFWRVKVWDETGETSQWSHVAYWGMGLLDPEEWKAEMIQPQLLEDPKKTEPCPMLRKEFTLKEGIETARLYITSHGLHEAHINGRRVGDAYFTPGWTAYHKCLQYEVYDVEDLLKPGENAMGVILGDGWFRGNVSYLNERNIYGDKLSLFLQLEITYTDGSLHRILSDETWRGTTGPILGSDMFNGETYDARLEKNGWDEAGYDDTKWRHAASVTFDPSILTAPVGVPVKKMEEITPKQIIQTPSGETVIDLGQNMVGWICLKAKGPEGTRITLQHGEVLDPEGNFYNKNLRMAKATHTYILKGSHGEESIEPRFSFQGFRYVKVNGYPGRLTLDKISGVVIHSNIEQTGEFSCSNRYVNQLFKNILWTQKGNFLDLPTDCPQRSERVGWTGDILVYGSTACLVMNSAAFLTRWLRDLKNDQKDSGLVPNLIPDPFFNKKGMVKRILKKPDKRKKDSLSAFDKFFAVFVLQGSAGWGDAGIFLPWNLYLYYGDKQILSSQYESMQALFRFREKQAGKFGSFLYINPVKWFKKETWKHLPYFSTAGLHFGDWLAPGDGMEKSIIKSKFYIPTVFYAMDALILSKVAGILGREADAAYYKNAYAKIKAAYQEFRVGKNGKIWPNRQAAYVLALLADLLPEDQKKSAVKMLAEKVRKDGNRIGTGFLGTPHICQILSDNGYTDVAYDLLLQEKSPSWLYQVKKGATTIWEHWDAIMEDGSFQSERMLSFSHYAYGAIGSWLFQGIAGINPDELEPGFKHIIIKPRPGASFTHAEASFESVYGLIKSEWSVSDGRLRLQIQVPPNTSASVVFPESYSREIMLNEKPLELKERTLKVGSGPYTFHCNS